MSIAKLFVKPNVRSVRLLIRGDPKDKEKVTGRTVKKFLDLFVVTTYDNKKVYRETITAHFYKKQMKVIVRATSRNDKDLSLDIGDFKKYAERRWGSAMLRLMMPIRKFEKGKEVTK